MPFTLAPSDGKGKGGAHTIPDSIRVRKSVADLVGLNLCRPLAEIRFNTKRLF
ncbi:hypothetical protein EMIT0196MI5_360022 [Pseudomonas sp. IT-196MI5]